MSLAASEAAHRRLSPAVGNSLVLSNNHVYVHHFDFREPPFSIAPDPQFLFLSPQHREALAHLLFGVGAGGGFVVLTGEVGTGKTTLCRCLLEQLPADVDLALIFNPRLNPKELLASICDELRLPQAEKPESLKVLIDRLNHHVLETHARGRRAIVLIDEAQNLRFDVLEQIRLLTNLETNREKLLQFILVGQPELNELLARPNLRQLAQRITARFHLRPMTFAETREYIAHRLSVAGVRSTLFTTAAIWDIQRRTGGIPRLINLLCDRSLLGAYTRNQPKVDTWIVRKAAKELRAPESEKRRNRRAAGWRIGLGLAALIGLLVAAYRLAPDEFEAQLRQWSDRIAALAAKVPALHPESQSTTAKSPPAVSPAVPPVVMEPPAAVPMSPDKTVGDAAAAVGPSPLLPPASGKSLAATIADGGMTRDAALSQLLRLWGLEPPEGNTDGCAFAENNGLRCLSMRSEWFPLASLNHPAVLELSGRNGSRRYVVLNGIDGQKIQLSVQGQPQVFELVEFLPLWRSNWTLVWRPPFADTRTLAPGERREGVRWLRGRLGGNVLPGQEDFFDNDLRARVFAFQIQRGLTPDGRVGPFTLLHLEAATATGPRLIPVRP